MIAGYTNAGVAPQMAIFAEAIAKVPQTRLSRGVACGAVSTAPRRGIWSRTMIDPDHRLVARIVTVLEERTQAQGDLLAATLAARWSASDRHEPAAHEWLRRWTPKPAHFVSPACTCAAGRCLVCN